MIKKYTSYVGGLLLLWSSHSALAFSAGVDYQVLDVKPIPPAMLSAKAKTVTVVEFFSYGCPWCHKLDPALMAWEKTQSAHVEFKRVPVVFQPQWSMFSKVFYVASDLGVEKKLHPDLFETVQASYPEDPAAAPPFSILKAADFSTDQGITAYFSGHGVKPEAINSVLQNTTRLNQQMSDAATLVKSMKIFEIPSVVVNGKYLISNRYTHGDNKKFIDTLNYLIESQ